MGQIRGLPLVDLLDDILDESEDESEDESNDRRSTEDRRSEVRRLCQPPMAGGPILTRCRTAPVAWGRVALGVVQRRGVPGEGTRGVHARVPVYPYPGRVHPETSSASPRRSQGVDYGLIRPLASFGHNQLYLWLIMRLLATPVSN